MSTKQLRKLRGNRVFEVANKILEAEPPSRSDEEEEDEDFEAYEKRMLALKMQREKEQQQQQQKQQQKQKQEQEASTVKKKDEKGGDKNDKESANLSPPLATAEVEKDKQDKQEEEEEEEEEEAIVSAPKGKKKKKHQNKKAQDKENGRGRGKVATQEKKKTAAKSERKGKEPSGNKAKASGNTKKSERESKEKKEEEEEEEKKNITRTSDEKSIKSKEQQKKEAKLYDAFIEEDLAFDKKCKYQVHTLLACDARYLDPNYEMRQKFGDIAVNSHLQERTTADNDDSNNNNNNGHDNPSVQSDVRRKTPANKRKQFLLKQMNKQKNKDGQLFYLFLINKQWPLPYDLLSKQSGNVYMWVYADVDNHYKYLNYEYDNLYEVIENEYKMRVARSDPHQLLEMLERHPYHMDTLLTVSNLFAQFGRLEDANDLIERCLYRFDCAFHSLMLRYFRINEKSSSSSPPIQLRLCYDIQSNRSFYYALWKYSQSVGRRGCVHTAFELTKYLLSLSPSRDPLCTLLCIDYWALRSFDWVWMLSFANDWILDVNTETGVRLLPNWCFGVALAKFKLEKDCGEHKNNLKKALKQSRQTYIHCAVAPGAIDRSKMPVDLKTCNVFHLSSSMLLQQAILMFPEVIAALIAKVDNRLLEDPKWMTLFDHPYFVNAKSRFVFKPKKKKKKGDY
ncbi:hypothetical protein RFI_35072 [Reticulomyxa filosa]|uniref:Transcription factor 25 n=1 Tax=Reticulomyxa filosa TaxID=46433 RepID=X6LM09_RETFI|nr:hypothetical protein RFI_35072 [Reticulomyxa filosa]|eukprot:ETO02366.1 hypothetical protein RFI_35072 [Reticulomyxa filosa]